MSNLIRFVFICLVTLAAVLCDSLSPVSVSALAQDDPGDERPNVDDAQSSRANGIAATTSHGELRLQFDARGEMLVTESGRESTVAPAANNHLAPQQVATVLRRLLEENQWWTMSPQPALIQGDPGKGQSRIAALRLRTVNGSWFICPSAVPSKSSWTWPGRRQPPAGSILAMDGRCLRASTTAGRRSISPRRPIGRSGLDVKAK